MKTLAKNSIIALAIGALASTTNAGENNKPPVSTTTTVLSSDLCKEDHINCYYSNEKLVAVEDLNTGQYVSYYDDGQIQELGTKKQTILVGEHILYYPNGNVWHHFNYNAIGKKEGVQLYYYENGSLQIKGYWNNGKIVGTVTRYDQNGNEIIVNNNENTVVEILE